MRADEQPHCGQAALGRLALTTRVNDFSAETTRLKQIAVGSAIKVEISMPLVIASGRDCRKLNHQNVGRTAARHDGHAATAPLQDSAHQLDRDNPDHPHDLLVVRSAVSQHPARTPHDVDDKFDDRVDDLRGDACDDSVVRRFLSITPKRKVQRETSPTPADKAIVYPKAAALPPAPHSGRIKR